MHLWHLDSFFHRLAIHAAKQSEQNLAFSGIVGLYEVLRALNEQELSLNKDQAVEIFELFTEALTRYDLSFGYVTNLDKYFFLTS